MDRLFSPLHLKSTTTRAKAFTAKVFRVAKTTAKGFSSDECSLKASALTYYSILSIVPVLAVAFGIAKGFGFEKHLEREVTDKFFDQKELAEKIISFAYSALQSAQGGLIAGVGVILLFWTVLKLLSNIESSFNAIWNIKQPRALGRRFSDYLAMMIFCPLFFATSSSLSIYIVTQVSRYSHTHGFWDSVSPLISIGFQLFPLILSWGLFTALYLIMPNTKVSLKCAFTAGIIAGTVFQVVQWLYINFQLGITSYGAIYGSFAALPLLVLWINISWSITLAGAEIAYHSENDMSLSRKELSKEHRLIDARLLGLSIARLAVHAFCQNSPPLTIFDFARTVGVNLVTARTIVEQLQEAGILSEVRESHTGYTCFQPGRDIKHITIKAVCDALNPARHTFFEALWDNPTKQFKENLEEIDQLVEKAPENTLLASDDHGKA